MRKKFYGVFFVFGKGLLFFGLFFGVILIVLVLVIVFFFLVLLSFELGWWVVWVCGEERVGFFCFYFGFLFCVVGIGG